MSLWSSGTSADRLSKICGFTAAKTKRLLLWPKEHFPSAVYRWRIKKCGWKTWSWRPTCCLGACFIKSTTSQCRKPHIQISGCAMSDCVNTLKKMSQTMSTYDFPQCCSCVAADQPALHVVWAPADVRQKSRTSEGGPKGSDSALCLPEGREGCVKTTFYCRTNVTDTSTSPSQ